MSELKFKESFRTCENITLKQVKLNENNVGLVWNNLKISKIITLDLSKNEFRSLHIDEGAKTMSIFEGFKNLIVLNLSQNPIENLHPNVFANLGKLVHLNLSYTNISKDHYFRCIKNLINLSHLDISGHKVHELTLTRFTKTIGAKFNNLVYLDIRPFNCPKTTKLTPNEWRIIEKHFPNLVTFNGIELKKIKDKTREKSTETVKNYTPVNHSVFFKEINNKIEQNIKELVVKDVDNKEKRGSNISFHDTKPDARTAFYGQSNSCFSPYKRLQKRDRSLNKSADYCDIDTTDLKDQYGSLHEFLNRRKVIDRNISQFTFKKCDQPDKISGKYIADMIDKKLNF